MQGIIKGLAYTLKHIPTKKVTHHYPDEPMEMPDRFRGIQHLDPEKCIVCNQCARVCPTDCITLSGRPHPDPGKKGKILDTYRHQF